LKEWSFLYDESVQAFRTKGQPLIAHAVDTPMASEANEIIVVLGHEADQVRTAIGNRRVGLVENTHLPPRAQHFYRRRVCRSACSGEGQIICHADQLLLEAGEVTS
jgi:molybdenum cofactor cytidylyltransferase